jgi:putative heme-binding domain-containing protein
MKWDSMMVPGSWEQQLDGKYDNLNGFAWYRCFINVPSEWEGKRLLLTVGSIGDVDEVFFNGDKIGANGSMPPLYSKPSSEFRRPAVIEPDQVRPGEYNLLAFRVYDKQGSGGILNGPIQLAAGNSAIDLSGHWLFVPGDQPDYDGRNLLGEEALMNQAAQQYLQIVGETPAGHKGIVETDWGTRNRDMQRVMEIYRDNKNVYSNIVGKGDALPPEEARKALRIADGLTVDTALHEPEVRQPLYVDFDERGRMWVTQYIQYPNPAGLEVITWDRHLRKVFDEVPPPPPYRKKEHRKFIGKDKITIHEDTNGDGLFDQHKTFLDGMNMVTSTAFGKDGVWVMNPPYLLFYPDANKDDVPDGDPEVHLAGFGLEDTHSISNSIKWGPDGWLYGATGSTVTARIRVLKKPSNKPMQFFGQNIWRYHPATHDFELFAEGGWNNFGVDFDDEGRLYSGTNGSMQAVHFVQGGYYQKSFGKHGPHTNPYSFGHFYGIPIEGRHPRLVHQWLIYGGGSIPGFDGLFIGGNSLSRYVTALQTHPVGSTFRSHELKKLITSDDKWFRPIHITSGPDGALYLSDWYDARITHVDPRDNWDRAHGRIYRLRSETSPDYPIFNLNKLNSDELLQLLSHSNRWYRSTARRLIADRGDKAMVPQLTKLLEDDSGQTSLEALWALNQLGAFGKHTVQIGLSHTNPMVRAWTIRLLGDSQTHLHADSFQSVLRLAESDKIPDIISQLASTATRLPADQGTELVKQLVSRTEFKDDPFIPQQIWWALESQISKDPEGVLTMLKDRSLWTQPIFKDQLTERLSRRLMSNQNERNLLICTSLLTLAPDKTSVDRLIKGMETALQGRAIRNIPPSMGEALNEIWKSRQPDANLIAFGMRIGVGHAFQAAREFITDGRLKDEERISLIQKLAELRDGDSQEIFLNLTRSNSEPEIKKASLNSLRRYSAPHIGRNLIEGIPNWKPEVRKTAISVLAGRPNWGKWLIQAVDENRIPREDIPFDVLFLIEGRSHTATNDRIQEIWGNLRKPVEEKSKQIDQIKEWVQSNKGNAVKGRAVFSMACAVCHKLFDQGRPIGPELTGYERDNLDFLLTAIIDPSLAVREEYELVTITLRSQEGEDAAVLTGFVTGIADQSLTLVDLVGNRTVLAISDISDQIRSPISVMPDGLLDGFSSQEIVDLFAYLQTPNWTN